MLRFLIGELVAGRINLPTLAGTFTANLLGCFAIGLLMGYAPLWQDGRENWQALLITGLLGGFTTFSAFSRETLTLLQEGRYALAITYALGSLTLGVLAAGVGYTLMHRS